MASARVGSPMPRARLDRQLAGDDGRGAAVAVVHDLEQIAPLLGRQGSEAPVVEDQELDPGEGLEEAGVPSVAAGEREGLEQPRHAMVEDGAVVAAGLVAERAGDPALADAGRAGDQQILVAVDPVASDELLEQGAVEAADGAQIDILDDGGLAQAGELEARDEALVVALGGLAVDQQAEALLEAECGDVGLSSLLLERLGHAGKPKAIKRSWVGWVSIVLSLSVVVAAAADVGVLDRSGSRRRPPRDRPGRGRSSGSRRSSRRSGADVEAAPAGRLEALGAIALGQAQDAEAGAEALLGMRLGAP